MSGPKVIRIVTRDEIIALCEGHLTRLNTAVEEWLRVGRRNDMLTEVEIAATRARHAGLRRLLEQDRFMELQKAVPDEIHFLAVDQEMRLARAAAEKAQARSAKRQTETAAVAVLKALEKKGVSVPDDLRSSLQETAAGRAEGASAISKAFALLSAQKTSAVSDHQRELAEKHRNADDRQTFTHWLAANAPADDDEELTRLNLRVAELTVLLGESATAEFETRLRRLLSAELLPNRSLLVDSLELDLVQAVTKAREREALELRLRMLADELSGLNLENSKQFSLTIAARISEPSDFLIKLEQEAQVVLDHAREEAAAQARRQAVLEGLAKLGYQVSESLETAWVQNGRVVIRRASQPGYGVELSGKIDSGRVQMRTVAVRGPGSSDSARDTDAETIFCSDVATLQKRLGEAGTELVIERALPVGKTPLKIVTDASDVWSDETQQHVPPTTKQRTIP
ncbi:MAG TPA: hypothetical protein VGO68_18950 [Pyrinomonadaceae bacterium]|jgi:hypothetical protein|nr:hypothetical protein [Pyrinomonadaceae bacterium]